VTTATRAPENLVTPSPVFYGIVGLTALFAVLLATGATDAGIMTFLFVVAGWILSLALHEFGHAVVAYIGGDRSVVEKGYLTLDVRKYVDVMTSLIIPIGILIYGGIGLPGGAVWINTGAIRTPMMRSLMSAAGPAASAMCGLICLVPVRLGLVGDSFLADGLSLLGWIQVIATIFNLLPVPGLDGFGIIEPHLSRQALQAIRPYRQYGMFLVIAAIFFIDPARDAFFSVTDTITEAIGGTQALDGRAAGWRQFRFWENR